MTSVLNKTISTSIDVKRLVSNYHSPEYKKYKDLLQIYQERKSRIQLKGSDQTKYFKETPMTYELRFDKIRIKIIKPHYKNVFKHIDELQLIKKELYIDYTDLQYLILNELDREDDYIRYDKIVKELTNINEAIQSLIEYHIQINLSQYILKDEQKMKLNQLTASHKELIKKIIEINDDIAYRMAMIEYFEMLKEIQDLSLEISQSQNTVHQSRIDYYILKLPEVVEQQLPDDDIALPRKRKQKEVNEMNESEINKARKSKLKSKIKAKLQEKTAEELQNMSSNVLAETKKEMFSLLKFNSKSECSSKNKKLAYYMTKAEIMEIIRKFPKLEAKLPRGYTRLSRDDICKEIYRL
jgi:hypothetical protein